MSAWNEGEGLPQGWAETTLGEVVNYGQTEKAEPEEIPLAAWVLELEDVERDTSKIISRATFEQRESKSTKNRFSSGDVLYGKLRPYLNKVVLADQDGYCTTEIVPIKSGEFLDSRFIFYWLKHPNFLNYVSAVSHGMNMPRLGTDAGREAPFILAPLVEQRRIADKLDALLSRVEAGRERLERVPKLLKKFRQAVLSAAVSGELTREWRGGGEAEWESTTVGNLLAVKPRNGYSPQSVEFETPVRSLTLSATTSGRFDGTKFKYIDEVISPDSYLWLKNGDILIQRANSPEYVGVSAIYKGENGLFIYPDLMMKTRAAEDVLTEFLHYTLLSEAVRNYFRENATGTAGNMPKINQQTVVSAPAFLPPLPEQAEIVRRVEALFALADSLEARAKTALASYERLTPALLAKAFRGELVAQDPADEPASVLLERIRAGRAAEGGAKKAGGAGASRRRPRPSLNCWRPGHLPSGAGAGRPSRGRRSLAKTRAPHPGACRGPPASRTRCGCSKKARRARSKREGGNSSSSPPRAGRIGPWQPHRFGPPRRSASFPRSTLKGGADVGRQEALLALKRDLVLTGGQLKRHCGAHGGLMHNVPHIDRLVVPIHMRAAVMPVVRFYSLNENLLRSTRAPFLGHITGTAEMRWLLGCPRSWRLGSHGSTAHDPDAVFRDEQRRLVAAEFDRGTYTRAKITKKIEVYRERGAEHIIWGVVSPLRGERLALLYPEIEVILVDWWN